MSHEIVERFGQLVIFYRDWVIQQFEHAVEGTDPAIRHQKRHRDLASLTDEQRAIVRREVIEGIDGAIHHLLWLFEQHDVNGFDVIFVGTDDDPVPRPLSVSDLSDGLGGEPYAEDGWIGKYADMRTSVRARGRDLGRAGSEAPAGVSELTDPSQGSNTMRSPRGRSRSSTPCAIDRVGSAASRILGAPAA